MAIARRKSTDGIRNWRGLTQRELADGAGLTQGFLSDLESRRRMASAETARKLASVLDVQLSWIEG